jgi:hypothetical protein
VDCLVSAFKSEKRSDSQSRLKLRPLGAMEDEGSEERVIVSAFFLEIEKDFFWQIGY